MPNPLVHRAFVTRQTLDTWRLRRFDWRGGATCIHVAVDHARRMGRSVPTVPGFTTPRGAMRVLKRMGHNGMGGLLDAHLVPIAPARMLVGDLAMVPGDEGDLFDALMIYDGLDKLIGWHGADPSRMHNVALAMGAVTAAWRV